MDLQSYPPISLTISYIPSEFFFAIRTYEVKRLHRQRHCVHSHEKTAIRIKCRRFHDFSRHFFFITHPPHLAKKKYIRHVPNQECDLFPSHTTT